ncbi:hypothetical protein A4G99_19265 [Haladaptatus sp. R4]|nr:hypothetical protein A4G99_19265 [Haladaptatus sp. R4]
MILPQFAVPSQYVETQTMVRVTGHDRCSRRRTAWLDVEVAKLYTTLGNVVDVRCRYLAPVTAEVAVSQVVDKGEDDIRPVILAR